MNAKSVLKHNHIFFYSLCSGYACQQHHSVLHVLYVLEIRKGYENPVQSHFHSMDNVYLKHFYSCNSLYVKGGRALLLDFPSFNLVNDGHPGFVECMYLEVYKVVVGERVE